MTLNARCCCLAFDSCDSWLYDVVLFLMCSSRLTILGLLDRLGSYPKSLSNEVIEVDRTWFRTMTSMLSSSAVMNWNSSTKDWSEITEIELATLELVGIVVCCDGRPPTKLALPERFGERFEKRGPELLKYAGDTGFIPPPIATLYTADDFFGDNDSGDVECVGTEAVW